MALTELEHKAVERALEDFLKRRRPPVHMRSELDVEYHLSGQSIEILEVRPDWRKPGEVTKTPVAKLTYVRTKGLWKIYWMRQDLRWHAYDPVAQVGTIEKALAVVDEDRNCCFFG
ncbi:DUF3024 domain-containing protein [Marinospirillum sp.]|uniref:DUF3024 domain-containing protein n=1 Tax=Marinospirillum sp. TaxID=2183934 RepID=UPI00384EEDB6